MQYLNELGLRKSCCLWNTRSAQRVCMRVCLFVHTCAFRRPSGVLVDKWPFGIDFNLENAALHFPLCETQGHPEGNPEVICQRKCITEGH